MYLQTLGDAFAIGVAPSSCCFLVALLGLQSAYVLVKVTCIYYV
jgi:hypothetical protein